MNHVQCMQYCIVQYSLVYTIHSLGRIPQFDKASLLYWLSSHLHQILCLRSTTTNFTKYHQLLLYFNYSNFGTIPIPYPLIKKSICGIKWVQFGTNTLFQSLGQLEGQTFSLNHWMDLVLFALLDFPRSLVVINLLQTDIFIGGH